MPLAGSVHASVDMTYGRDIYNIVAKLYEVQIGIKVNRSYVIVRRLPNRFIGEYTLGILCAYVWCIGL